MTTEEKIDLLVKGDLVVVKDEAERKIIQRRLRDYKKYITIVLSQLKNGI